MRLDLGSLPDQMRWIVVRCVAKVVVLVVSIWIRDLIIKLGGEYSSSLKFHDSLVLSPR